MSTQTDPIADMLSRIRNAIAAGKQNVNIPHSNMKAAVAKLLKANNFIEDVKVVKNTKDSHIEITINHAFSTAKITEINRLSKPGRRQYAGVADIPKIKSGRGIVIVSTPKGLMTGSEASKHKVGGELICEVY